MRNLKWYYNRLKIMSPKEVIFFRLPQQLQLKIFGRFQKNIKFNTSLLEVNPNFKTATYSKESLEVFIDDKAEIFDFKFFDCSIDLSKPINWLKDYKNQIESKTLYYGKIDRQNFNLVGDIKYVCEPSRFYFLPFLAFKAIQTKDQKFLEIIKTILKDWSNQNPYLKSIHWTSGIEVGIRSVNLTYTHLLLKSSGLLSEEINTLIKGLILQGYHFLKNHLSLYSSANNHLVAELTGLVTISSYFNNKEIKRNKKKWQDKLYREILNQINKDGINMELCTHYHAEVTDHFLNALHFIESSGETTPKNIQERFVLMFDFIDHVEYNGKKTIYGDNDEGYLIFPYYQEGFSIYTSLLGSAMIKYNKSFSSTDGKSMDLRNYLIFGEAIFKKKENNAVSKFKDRIFESSGYAFLYDEEYNVKLSFDFGTIGDSLSAAHGHSDIFHFTFEKNGEQFLVDSGTYQYHKKHNKWRTYFRGISAHNTISINNKDHALQASRMSWIGQPKTTLIDYQITEEKSFIEAETDAFKKEGVIHRRKLSFDRKNKTIVVIDTLKKISKDNKSNVYQYRLNFDESISFVTDEKELTVKSNKESITIQSDIFSNNIIKRANTKNKLGWRSKKYNLKHQGYTIMIKKSFTDTKRILTKIYY